MGRKGRPRAVAFVLYHVNKPNISGLVQCYKVRNDSYLIKSIIIVVDFYSVVEYYKLILEHYFDEYKNCFEDSIPRPSFRDGATWPPTWGNLAVMPTACEQNKKSGGGRQMGKTISHVNSRGKEENEYYG